MDRDTLEVTNFETLYNNHILVTISGTDYEMYIDNENGYRIVELDSKNEYELFNRFNFCHATSARKFELIAV